MREGMVRDLTAEERRRFGVTLPGYFVAPGADDTPTLWRGDPTDWAPKAVISKDELANHPAVWGVLAAAVEMLAEDVRRTTYSPHGPDCRRFAGGHYECPAPHASDAPEADAP